MKNLLCIALFLCASVAEARPHLFRPAATAAVEQRVTPPQDTNKWYCSVFADEQTAMLYAGWFKSNPTLSKLQSQTHFAVYPTSAAMFKERYASNTKAPCIRVQDARGFVVYPTKAGQPIPKTAEKLATEISVAIKSYSGPVSGPFRKGGCPCGPGCDCVNCPWRKDKPQPEPQPSPQPDPQPQPDPAGPPEIDDEPASNEPSALLIAASAAAGIGLGARRKWVNAYIKK